MKQPPELNREAEALFHVLRERDLRIVFAESCTGGLLASSLVTFPGISSHLVGSFVTYQEEAKVEWLGVSESILRRKTAVSHECLEAMLRGALDRSQNSDIAVATSGYLGPGNSRDGSVFIGFLSRGEKPVIVELSLCAEKKLTPVFLREKRRFLATTLTLFLVRSLLTQNLYTS